MAHLVQQRLEEVVVRAVDERDVDVAPPEDLRGGEAAEAAADDDHAMARCAIGDSLPPTNSSSARLTSSGCVQAMLCGPPSIATSSTSSISAGSRAAVASYGRIRSSVPWTTSTGTSIFGRSRRKSVSQVSTHA